MLINDSDFAVTHRVLEVCYRHAISEIVYPGKWNSLFLCSESGTASTLLFPSETALTDAAPIGLSSPVASKGGDCVPDPDIFVFCFGECSYRETKLLD